MKKYALIFKCPTCGKVVQAIAFNKMAEPDFASEVSSDIADCLEYQLIPEIIPNPERNFEWCDCQPSL